MTALEKIVEIVESQGFYRWDESEDIGVTMWTCDAWAEWWTDPKDGHRTRRKMFLLEVLADIIGRESGWDSIRRQPV